MARHFLGNMIDIHCDDQNLTFPHHENEITQNECCNGVPLTHYWMHNGYINVDNHKMSRSLDDFFTVWEVTSVYGYGPIRFLMVSSQYCNLINYNVETIEQCKSAPDHLYSCCDNLTFARDSAPEGLKDDEQEQTDTLNSSHQYFIIAMDNDLDVADAISVLFDLTREINTNLVPGGESKEPYNAALRLYGELTDVLGLPYQRKDQSLNEETEALIQQRTSARKNKD